MSQNNRQRSQSLKKLFNIRKEKATLVPTCAFPPGQRSFPHCRPGKTFQRSQRNFSSGHGECQNKNRIGSSRDICPRNSVWCRVPPRPPSIKWRVPPERRPLRGPRADPVLGAGARAGLWWIRQEVSFLWRVVIAHALSLLPKHAWLASERFHGGTNNSSNNKHTLNTRVSCRKRRSSSCRKRRQAPSTTEEIHKSQFSSVARAAEWLSVIFFITSKRTGPQINLASTLLGCAAPHSKATNTFAPKME